MLLDGWWLSIAIGFPKLNWKFLCNMWWQVSWTLSWDRNNYKKMKTSSQWNKITMLLTRNWWYWQENDANGRIPSPTFSSFRGIPNSLKFWSEVLWNVVLLKSLRDWCNTWSWRHGFQNLKGVIQKSLNSPSSKVTSIKRLWMGMVF